MHTHTHSQSLKTVHTHTNYTVFQKIAISLKPIRINKLHDSIITLQQSTQCNYLQPTVQIKRPHTIRLDYMQLLDILEVGVGVKRIKEDEHCIEDAAVLLLGGERENSSKLRDMALTLASKLSAVSQPTTVQTEPGF